MYTEEELQETIEYLEKKVERCEEVLETLLLFFTDEESFSSDTREQMWNIYHDLNKD